MAAINNGQRFVLFNELLLIHEQEINMSGLAQGTSTHVSLISMAAYAKSSSCFRRNKENFTMPGSPMGKKMEELAA
ncbi:hypothetical protein AALP_AAs50665U000600 [Arabis alpina]|uniref:Uncharacterized protein n=1 Tax=Arabis alpina TaxID=50452 RepID=A0A087FX57_ARAAL|nr:hypothetical protein AALP_AAs50665U000600 [Arabis alpina]